MAEILGESRTIRLTPGALQRGELYDGNRPSSASPSARGDRANDKSGEEEGGIMSLQILIAHTGERLEVDPLGFNSLDAFRVWIEKATSIPAPDQILLTGRAKHVKLQALLLEVRNRTWRFHRQSRQRQTDLYSTERDIPIRQRTLLPHHLAVTILPHPPRPHSRFHPRSTTRDRKPDRSPRMAESIQTAKRLGAGAPREGPDDGEGSRTAL